MPQQQIYSAQEVDFGNYIKMFWAQGFAGDGSVVPASHTLEITNLTINYFPKQTGRTLGRADIAGRDAAGIGTGTLCGNFRQSTRSPRRLSISRFPRL